MQNRQIDTPQLPLWVYFSHGILDYMWYFSYPSYQNYYTYHRNVYSLTIVKIIVKTALRCLEQNMIFLSYNIGLLPHVWMNSAANQMPCNTINHTIDIHNLKHRFLTVMLRCKPLDIALTFNLQFEYLQHSLRKRFRDGLHYKTTFMDQSPIVLPYTHPFPSLLMHPTQSWSVIITRFVYTGYHRNV